MYPLLLCSLTALTVIIERAIFWTRERRSRDQRIVDGILEHAERNDYNEAARLGSGSDDYVTRILVCGIVHRNFSLNRVTLSSSDRSSMDRTRSNPNRMRSLHVSG